MIKICKRCLKEKEHYAKGFCVSCYNNHIIKKTQPQQKFMETAFKLPASFVYAYPGIVSPAEKKRIKHRVWYRENKEKRQEYSKNYYQKNKELIKRRMLLGTK